MPILSKTQHCHCIILPYFAVAAPYVTHAKLFAALPWLYNAKLYQCISLHCQCLAIHCHRYALQNLTMPLHICTLPCQYSTYALPLQHSAAISLPKLRMAMQDITKPIHRCAPHYLCFAPHSFALPLRRHTLQAFPRAHLTLPCCAAALLSATALSCCPALLNKTMPIPNAT